MVNIIFNDSSSISCTRDHPLLSDNNKWRSLSPNSTKVNYKEYSNIQLLKIGNRLLTTNGFKTIKSITHNNSLLRTYTIVKLKNNRTFVANNIIVGTEELINSNTLINR